MSTIAERTFVINTQAVGTIELTATLESANASLASYITENRTYLDGVRAGIDSDLATLTAEANTERGSAYNKNFGILDNTVAEGSHVHDDRYYTKANVQSLLDGFQLLIETEETGFNLPLGNTANTVAAGNDPRFSDAREPTAHSHTKSAITDFDESDYATAAQGTLAASALQQNTADARYYQQVTMDALLRGKEPAFDKNSGFNLPLGTEHNTVARGDHTHTHFNHEITTETTHALSAFNVVTTKNYVDEKVRQLLESEGFVFKHNEMLLLDGDDHLQYHTDARGDARYPLIQDLAAEITNRTAADNTLQNAITTEVSDRTAADNAINGNITANETARAAQRISDLSDIAENIQDVDDAAVHILGNQVIDGEKRFLGDVIVEGEAILQNVTIKSQSELDVGDAIVLLNAGETGTPSVNAGFEIERGTAANAQLLFDESADQWVAGIEGALDRVALGVDITQLNNDKFDKSGGSLSGNLTISRTNPTLSLTTSDTTSATIRLTTGSNLGGILQATDSGRMYLRKYDKDDGTTITGEIEFNDAGFITNSVPMRGVDDPFENAASFLTKGYVEDNFLSTTDTGEQSVAGDFTVKTPSAVVLISSTNSHPRLRLRKGANGDEPIGQIYGDIANDQLRIQKKNDSDVTENELQLRSTYSIFSQEVRGPDPVNDAAYTPKKYVEDNFLSLDGGTVKDTLIVKGPSDDFTELRIDSTGDNNSIVRFYRDGTRLGRITQSATGLDMIYLPAAGGFGAQLALFADYAQFNKEVRGPDPVDNAAYTPKKYVEDNFLSLNGGTIAGLITAEDIDISGSTPRLNMVATSTTGATIVFYNNSGELKTDFYVEGAGGSERTVLRNRTGSTAHNALVIDKASMSFQNDPQADNMGTNDKSLTTKKYVEDNFLSLDGGALKGNLTIKPDTGDSNFHITSIDANPIQRFYRDGIAAGRFVGFSSRFEILKYTAAGVDASSLNLYDNYIIANNEVRGPNPTNDAGFTPKSYVEDNFAPIDSPIFNHDVVIQEDSGRPQLYIRTKDGTSEGQIRFQRGVPAATSVTLYDLSDRFILRKHDAGGDSDITMYPTKTVMAKRVEIGGDLDIDGRITSTGINRIQASAPQLYLTSDDAEGTTYLVFENGGGETSRITGLDGGLRVEYTGGSRLQLGPTSASFTTALYIEEPQFSGQAATKGYVDNNFLGLAGGVLTDDIQIRSAAPIYKMRRDDDTKTMYIVMSGANGATNGEIAVEPDSAGRGVTVRHRSGGTINNEFKLNYTYSISTKEVRGPSTDATNSDPTSFVTKDYIDNVYTPSDATTSGAIKLKEATNNGSGNVLLKAPDSISSSYSVTMPASRGNVGDVLVCVSVTPSTMTMAWQAP